MKKLMPFTIGVFCGIGATAVYLKSGESDRLNEARNDLVKLSDFVNDRSNWSMDPATFVYSVTLRIDTVIGKLLDN